jgi:hypothetical protein
MYIHPPHSLEQLLVQQALGIQIAYVSKPVCMLVLPHLSGRVMIKGGLHAW